MAQGGLVRGYATGGEVSREAPEAPSQGTFLNPATGSYEPLKQPPPAPSPTDQTAASEQAAQPASDQYSHPAIAHLAAVNRQEEQRQQQEAQRQQQQAELAAWQNQNTHPASAGDALQWAKQWHTGYKTATFMANGGPNGEPAYNFSDGKGLTNTVPLSQMVKNGFAPTMVAQNTSPVLSTLEQNRQQGQGPTGPGLPMGPVSPAQQPQPDQSQVAQQGAPSVWNPQQPAPGPTAPAAPGGPPQNVPYDPAAAAATVGSRYQQTLAGINRGNVAPAGLIADVDKAGAPAPAQSTAPSAADMENDAKQANPIYHWQYTPDGKHKFADLPQSAAQPFLKQRFYLGSTGFVPVQGNPEDWEKQQIFDALANTGSAVPRPRDAQGNFMHFDYNTINNMDAETRQKWIDYIKDFNMHQKSVDPTDANGRALSDSQEGIKAAQRVEDKILWAKENNIPMRVISQDELTRSEVAGWAKSAEANNPAGSALFGMWSHTVPPNLFADALRGDYKVLNSHLNKVPGGEYEGIASTPEHNEFGLNLKPQWPIEFGLPLATNVSTGIPALNNIGTTDDYDAALGHIREVKNSAINTYRKTVSQLPTNGLRVPPEALKNIDDLNNPNKGYIDDPTNRMWDKDHKKLVNPYMGKEGIPYVVSGPTGLSALWGGGESGKWKYVGGEKAEAGPPSASATQPSVSEAREALRQAGGLPSGSGAEAHVANSMDDVKKIMGLKPSGTHFHYKGQEYMVP
jgi:hypothetical protein